MSDQRTLQGFFTSLLADQAIGQMVAVAVSFVPGGSLVAPLVSKALEYYGVPVADNLVKWVRGQKGPQACAVLEAVANLSPAEAMQLAQAAVKQTAPPNAPPERLRAIENYLASIPAAFKQSMPRAEGGKTTCPAALLPQTERQAMALLPTYLPPYNAPCELPGTPYQLVRLVGTGGFGAVYEAVTRYEVEPRAIKFCLDPERANVLKRERAGFAVLMKQASKQGWPAGVVRYYGDDLEHPTPFLIFEYAPDGDLVQYVQTQKARTGRAMTPEEVLTLMRELATAAGQMHAVGLTHRDLKPSNVLFAGKSLRIADLGLGAVMPQGYTATRLRSIADTTQEARGAGTALYMAPEQERGADPHPTQDVYSLGVIWYQLLIEDFSRKPGPSWRRTLQGRNVPTEHLDALEHCLDEEANNRPKTGVEFVSKLNGMSAEAIQRKKAEEADSIRRKKAEELAEATKKQQEERERETRLQQQRKQAEQNWESTKKYSWIATLVLLPAIACAIATFVLGLLPKSIFQPEPWTTAQVIITISGAMLLQTIAGFLAWGVFLDYLEQHNYRIDEDILEPLFNCFPAIPSIVLFGLVWLADSICKEHLKTTVFTLAMQIACGLHLAGFLYLIVAARAKVMQVILGWLGIGQGVAGLLMLVFLAFGFDYWIWPLISFGCIALALTCGLMLEDNWN